MSKSISLPRTVRGRRPTFSPTAGVDEAMTMILALAQEVVVLRERFDAAERVAASQGFSLAEHIEDLLLDEAALAARETWRQAFYDRLFHFARQRRAELEEQHTEESYLATLAAIKRGD